MFLFPNNTVKVMTRSYFTVMMMFSDLGGIIEFLSVATFLLYSFYNSYKVNKHVILKVLLAKTNLLPEKYNIKNDFNSITRSKVCSCFCKNDKRLTDKVQIYEDCYKVVSEKME